MFANHMCEVLHHAQGRHLLATAQRHADLKCEVKGKSYILNAFCSFFNVWVPKGEMILVQGGKNFVNSWLGFC